MKRVILLIFICLFCFGCEAKYELRINEDLSVDENITGLETDTFYNQYYKSTKERVINFMMETKQDYLNEIGYNKEIVRENNLTGALIGKNFSSLEEYFSKSKAYTQFYNDMNYKIKNGIVTIDLKNQLLKNNDSLERYVIDNCDVIITLPFKVKDSNADYVNNSTNTYTWELSGNKQKDIYIKFDTSKMADYDYKDVEFISYIIIGVLVVGILAVIYVVYKKNKLNNEV